MLLMTPTLFLENRMENILFPKLLDLAMNFKLPAGLNFPIVPAYLLVHLVIALKYVSIISL